MTDGERGKLRGRADGRPFKCVGLVAGKSATYTPETWTSGVATPCEPPMLRRLEKPLGIEPGTVPKPTQVGGYQYTKARERNLVKELGNLAP